MYLMYTIYKYVSCLFKVKEDTIAKEKTEKIDTSSKTDILNAVVKADAPENLEKTDNKKVDSVSKIHEAEKQDSKAEKNGKCEETKKEAKEEKKNGSEKVNKTVKNEKNVKAAKETSKPTAANGTKANGALISPDKVKVCLQEEGHQHSYMFSCSCV